MVTEIFGFPRSGKTTVLTRTAIRSQINITRSLSKYKHVYSNVGVNYPGIRSIKWDYLGKYDYKDCLVLIDEGTLFADNRNYKNFPQEKIDWLMTHGHDRCDVIIFCQAVNGVDKKIRDVTERVGYVRKFFFWSIITYLPRSIVIPEQTGEVTMGFRKPKAFELIRYTRFVFRPAWYPFFDSWHEYIKRPQPLFDEVGGDPRDKDIAIGVVVRALKKPLHRMKLRRIRRRQYKHIRRPVRRFVRYWKRSVKKLKRSAASS